MKAALSRPDVQLVAGSGAVRGMLQEMGREPIATVTAGLSPQFRRLQGSDQREAIVGFALRSEPVKDMELAFAAARLVRARLPDVSFTCFGSARVDVPDGIRPLGRLTDSQLAEFYNRCSVFMLPSRWEGWGLPAAEAMACGAAVVSTRNGGVEEFIVDGQTGLLVDRGSPEAMAAAICRLIELPSLRVHLATQALEAVEDMSVERSVTRLETLLLRLAHGEADSW